MQQDKNRNYSENNIVLQRIQKILFDNRKKINDVKLKKYSKTTIIEIDDIFSNNPNYTLDFVYFEQFKSIAENEKLNQEKIQKQRELWRIRKNKYRQANKEKVLTKQREYYHKNKDKILPQIYKARSKRKSNLK